jgi:hypothetical protein
MKNLVVLLFILLAVSAKTQPSGDTTAYTNSIRLNILGLPLKTITVFADHYVNRRNYLEFTAGYHFQGRTDNSKILFIHIKDPFWFYYKFKAGVGYNHFYKKHLYMGPYLQYQYQYFDKIRIHAYVDHEGEQYDEDWILSRNKNEIGTYLKFGYSSIFRKKMMLDFYFDLGLNFMYTREKVWSRIGLYNSQIPGEYPISTTKVTFPFAINMGFTVGFRN